MSRFHLTVGLAAVVSAALAPARAQAFFHAWTFSEFFSSADGSVQFIEMFTTLATETQSATAEIRTDSGNVFDFPGNLSGSTANKRLLIAIADVDGDPEDDFASLPGAVAPDFILPTTNFFNPAGDRIRLFHPSLGEFQMKTFTSVPTDGVMSLNYPPAAGTPLTNSPQNFSGAMGSVNVPPLSLTGDFNEDETVDAADYVVWRKAADLGLEDLPNDNDDPGAVGTAEYDLWRGNFGNTTPGSGGGLGTVPEPGSWALLFAFAFLAARHRWR